MKLSEKLTDLITTIENKKINYIDGFTALPIMTHELYMTYTIKRVDNVICENIDILAFLHEITNFIEFTNTYLKGSIDITTTTDDSLAFITNINRETAVISIVLSDELVRAIINVNIRLSDYYVKKNISDTYVPIYKTINSWYNGTTLDKIKLIEEYFKAEQKKIVEYKEYLQSDLKLLTFAVNFWSKKDNVLLHVETVKSDNNVGIILKGKQQALGNDFRFDKKLHTTSFTQI
jgi:hypothetical protein